MMSKTRAFALVGVVALLLASGARIAAEPTSAPRFEWFVDGVVNASARLGNTLYVGGSFRRIIPPSGVLGRLYAVSPATGAQAVSGLPKIDATNGVRVMADGTGGYYLHGNLTIGTGNAVAGEHREAPGLTISGPCVRLLVSLGADVQLAVYRNDELQV